MQGSAAGSLSQSWQGRGVPQGWQGGAGARGRRGLGALKKCAPGRGAGRSLNNNGHFAKSYTVRDRTCDDSHRNFAFPTSPTKVLLSHAIN